MSVMRGLKKTSKDLIPARGRYGLTQGVSKSKSKSRGSLITLRPLGLFSVSRECQLQADPLVGPEL